MSDSVGFEIKADATSLLTAQKEIIVQQQKVIDSFRKLGPETEKNKRGVKTLGAAFKDTFGTSAMGMLRTLTGALGISFGVAGAVRLVRSEIAALMETQSRMADASRTKADAQLGFRRMLGAMTVADAEEADRILSQIAKSTGVSTTLLYPAAASAVSARGNLPLETAFSAVETAARFVPENEQERTVLAGSILDLMKATGGKDPMASVGMLMAASRISRPTTIGDIGQNVSRTAIQAMQMGMNEREAAAMFALFTQFSADAKGKRSASGMTDFLVELQKFGAAKQIEGNPLEILLEIQKNKSMLAEFQGTMTPQIQSRGAIFGISSGELRQQYEEFYNRLPASPAEAAAEARAQLGVLHSGGLQQVGQFGRQVDVGLGGVLTADPRQAMLGVVQKTMGPMLHAAGYLDLETKLAGIGTFQNLDAKVEEFHQAGVQLQAPMHRGMGYEVAKRKYREATGAHWWTPNPSPEEVIPYYSPQDESTQFMREKQQSEFARGEALIAMADALKQILDVTREGNEDRKEIKESTKPGPGHKPLGRAGKDK